MIKYLFVVLPIWLFALPLQAEQVYNLNCHGYVMGVKASIQGKRSSTPYAFGNEYAK